jgi:hypothetical protein
MAHNLSPVRKLSRSPGGHETEQRPIVRKDIHILFSFKIGNQDGGSDFNIDHDHIDVGICALDNVRRFLRFQLTLNVAAVFIAFIGSTVAEGESPLTPMQLPWVNMTMLSLGALPLATEKPRPYLIEQPS